MNNKNEKQYITNSNQKDIINPKFSEDKKMTKGIKNINPQIITVINLAKEGEKEVYASKVFELSNNRIGIFYNKSCVKVYFLCIYSLKTYKLITKIELPDLRLKIIKKNNCVDFALFDEHNIYFYKIKDEKIETFQ